MKVVITLQDGPVGIVEIDCSMDVANPTLDQLNASKAARLMLAFRHMLENPNIGQIIEDCPDPALQ